MAPQTERSDLLQKSATLREPPLLQRCSALHAGQAAEYQTPVNLVLRQVQLRQLKHQQCSTERFLKPSHDAPVR
jgi:hypothetical protein